MGAPEGRNIFKDQQNFQTSKSTRYEKTAF